MFFFGSWNTGNLFPECNFRSLPSCDFSFAPDISPAKGAATDILKLLDSVPEIDAESSEGKVLDDKAVRGHVKFENVHFRYPTRPGVRVLRDLTLEVEPGTYIALVGASGCGKSTT